MHALRYSASEPNTDSRRASRHSSASHIQNISQKFATETLISLLPALAPSELKAVVFQLLSVLTKKE